MGGLLVAFGTSLNLKKALPSTLYIQGDLLLVCARCAQAHLLPAISDVRPVAHRAMNRGCQASLPPSLFYLPRR